MIRCKKAQSFTRPFNQKTKVKAGGSVQQKLATLIEMTKENDFGELAGELKTLDKMIKMMQMGVLEALLDSIETIERRMKSYQTMATKRDEQLNDSVTSFDLQEEDHEMLLEKLEARPVSERTIETSRTVENTDGWNDRDDEIGMEIATTQQERFKDRLENFFSIQRVAAERVQMIDPQGKVRNDKQRYCWNPRNTLSCYLVTNFYLHHTDCCNESQASHQRWNPREKRDF